MLSKWNAGAGVVCLVGGALAQLAQVLVTPIAGDATPAEEVAAAAAHPGAMGWATGLDLPILLFIPAVLWIGWAAGGGRSTLSAVGTGLAFLGVLGGGYLLAGDVVAGEGARLADRSAGVAVVTRYLSSGPVDTAVVLLLVGELAGFVLLGIALAKARTVPVWAAVGVGAYPVLDMAAHLAGLPVLSALAYVVLTASVLPVAVAVLRAARANTEVPAVPAGVATS